MGEADAVPRTSSRACALDACCDVPPESAPVSRLLIHWILSGRLMAIADFIWPACLVSRC